MLEDAKRTVHKAEHEQAGKYNGHQSAFNRGRFAADRKNQREDIHDIHGKKQDDLYRKRSFTEREYRTYYAKRKKVEACNPC